MHVYIIYMCIYRNVTGSNVHELAIVHVYDNLAISVIVRPTAVVYIHACCVSITIHLIFNLYCDAKATITVTITVVYVYNIIFVNLQHMHANNLH